MAHSLGQKALFATYGANDLPLAAQAALSVPVRTFMMISLSSSCWQHRVFILLQLAALGLIC